MKSTLSQHTPGPWTVDGNHFQIWANDGENAVASVYSTASPEPMASEARANARLIAAAPDLLAALEDSLTVIRLMGCDMSNFSNSCAALARAKGGAAMIP